jgi:hypothetical protein
MCEAWRLALHKPVKAKRVIPGPAAGRNPESRTLCEEGWIPGSRYRAPRNDERHCLTSVCAHARPPHRAGHCGTHELSFEQRSPITATPWTSISMPGTAKFDTVISALPG